MVLDDDGNFSHQHDTFQYQNVAAVTIKGVELTGNYFIDEQWSMFANMSYVDGKDDETNQYIDTITPLTGIAGLSFENENLVTKLVVNWATKMNKINPEKASTAGFGVIDLLANYEINAQLTLNLNLSNILDKEYIKYGNIAGHAESTSLVNQTEPGRTIAASMVYRF
jgi:hemoglobin/transferrin/lactoferrin receptor protein